ADRQCQNGVLQAGAEDASDGYRQQDRRKGVEYISQTHDGAVDETADVAGGEAEGPTDQQRQEHRHQPRQQGKAPAKYTLGPEVASNLVGAEPMARRSDGLQPS